MTTRAFPLVPHRHGRIPGAALLAALLPLASCGARAGAAAPDPLPTAAPGVKITLLATNGADYFGAPTPLQAEFSFCALVEVGERTILFDTGWTPGNVLYNAEILGVDLSAAEDVVLSHYHVDHTGGIEALRTELSRKNPKALSRVHVGRGIFASRPEAGGTEGNRMIAVRRRMEALGSTFLVHDGPAELAPGVWVTGTVPRVHDERNYPVGAERVVLLDGELVPDVIPESQSLVVLAAEGPILVSGCGHAGLVNTLDHVRARISPLPPLAAIGGFHMFAASPETLRWTSEKLSEAGLRHFLGAHCTGFEAVVTIRELMGLEPERARIGAVGTRFEPAHGIVAGNINS